MDSKNDVNLIYVPELARLLNTTECAIRTRIARGSGVPARYKNSSRVCWLREDVYQFLRSKVKTDGTSEQP